jgi:hypothetical protein
MGPNHPTKTIEGVYTIYSEATRANYSSVCLEVRVPYKFATMVLANFKPDRLRQCLCLFT